MRYWFTFSCYIYNTWIIRFSSIYIQIQAFLRLRGICAPSRLCVVYYGSAVMCRARAGESLLTKGGGGGGGGGDAGTWEPLANPPSARHGTFTEQGPPTLKACNRQQTQQRDRPCSGRTIFGDESAVVRGGGAANGANKEAVKHGGSVKLRVAEWRLTDRKTVSFHRCGSGESRSPGTAVRCSIVRFAPSVL